MRVVVLFSLSDRKEVRRLMNKFYVHQNEDDAP